MIRQSASCVGEPSDRIIAGDGVNRQTARASSLRVLAVSDFNYASSPTRCIARYFDKLRRLLSLLGLMIRTTIDRG